MSKISQIPGLPIFNIDIVENDESNVEVDFVALVDKPAIEKNFLVFNNEKKVNFAIENEEQRIVTGPLMLADTPIYRNDENGEYYVVFSKDSIKRIVQKYFRKGYQNNVNLMHDSGSTLEGLTMFESWIVDEKRGNRALPGYEDAPQGSWFGSFKVENDQVWAMIKEGKVRGFSVEGLFSYKKKEVVAPNKLIEALRETLDGKCYLSKIEIMTIKEMISELKHKFAGEVPPVPPPPAPPTGDVVEPVEVVLADGTVCKVDKMEAGGVILTEDVPLAAGDYDLQDGSKIKVGEAGVIMEVIPADPNAAAAPVAPDPNEMANQKYDAQFASINEKFMSYEQKFAAYEDRFAKAEGALNKANETIVALVGIVEKLSEVPTADPIGGSKNQFKSDKAKSKDEARQALIDTIQNLKIK